ncbi:fructokinase [Rhizomicrobium electricum]|nr:ROK family protein [Rhizomicrobium electricum]NIJ49131.1 fructokinase [Rhizomicrobium electricum]
MLHLGRLLLSRSPDATDEDLGAILVIQIGIDFGGTKIEAAALNVAGDFVKRIRAGNPGSYDAALAIVRDLVQRIETELGEHGTVGLGVPGSISPSTGVMRNANSVYLNGRPFREDLEKTLGRPIRMVNDANCLALSESVDGAAKGANVAFAVILGTGCGGGLVVGGKLIEGASGVAGEWGHMPLPWPAPEELPGPTCWCGQSGCLEYWISGTGLQRDYGEATGESLASERIIADYRSGRPEAVAAFKRYIDRLGRAIAVLCNIVDPDVVVMGGGLSNVDEIYELLPAAVAKRIFSDVIRTKFVKARWGDSSGVRGAARLWPLPANETKALLAKVR